jgi:hypothetical protein
VRSLRCRSLATARRVSPEGGARWCVCNERCELERRPQGFVACALDELERRPALNVTGKAHPPARG